jgi:hypothetical protein
LWRKTRAQIVIDVELEMAFQFRGDLQIAGLLVKESD